jgi:hypothetical protein
VAEQVGDGLINECATFDGFLRMLRAGDLYVNVHTPVVPSGEIRGQIPRPPHVQHFPQFGNGEGLQSDIEITAAFMQLPTTEPVTGVLRFYDAFGEPLTVGLLAGGMGGFMADEVPFMLDPLGKFKVSTDGLGDLAQGSAVAVVNAPAGGVVKFAIEGVGIAGVSGSPSMKAAILPVKRTDETNTGVAARNTASQPTTLVLTLRDTQGVAVADGLNVVTLPAGARISQFISELFPAADTDDFEGTLLIEADQGSFAAVGLELGFTGPGLFTTLPVTPVR